MSDGPLDDDLEPVRADRRARLRRWIAALVAVALIVPLGTWAVDEVAFSTAGSQVEQRLGDEADLLDALLLVRSRDCLGRSTSGSAFAVVLDDRPVVVTNRHVVEGANTISLRAAAGGPALAVVAHHVAQDADVAVLELAEPSAVRGWLVAGPPAAVGDEVRVVGFPSGLPTLRSGSVAGADEARLELDLEVRAGASGSPVLDHEGRVVGQTYARTSEGRGLATPIMALREAASHALPAAPCP